MFNPDPFKVKKADGIFFVMRKDETTVELFGQPAYEEEQANELCKLLNEVWGQGFDTGKYKT